MKKFLKRVDIIDRVVKQNTHAVGRCTECGTDFGECYADHLSQEGNVHTYSYVCNCGHTNVFDHYIFAPYVMAIPKTVNEIAAEADKFPPTDMSKDDNATNDFEDKILNLDAEFDHDWYERREWADDIEKIRKALKILRVYTSHEICYRFWSWYSNQNDAGWLDGTTYEIAQVYKSLMKR